MEEKHSSCQRKGELEENLAIRLKILEGGVEGFLDADVFGFGMTMATLRISTRVSIKKN